MDVTVRKPCRVENEIKMQKIGLSDINIYTGISNKGLVLSIDGSTTNTGVAILTKDTGSLLYSCAFCRAKDETPVRYKLKLKNAIKNIIENNNNICNIYYEEPFIGHASSVASLMMLRTFVEELIIENEPRFDKIVHKEINNKKWKSLFLKPDKCPTGTELEKKAVRDKLLSYLPMLSDVTQDEIDAIAMGFVVCNFINKGAEEELDNKVKVHPFSYEVKFIGADDDEGLLIDFMEIYTGPKSILENGLQINEIVKATNFDKIVYNSMGIDDKVLILKFSSNKCGNIILKHRLGKLAQDFEYIYCVIWRSNRKK